VGNLTTKGELELVARGTDGYCYDNMSGLLRGYIACCYGNMLLLLWGYVAVAVETRCGYALMPCGCVNMS
jgi:hypothetical protein